MTNLEAAMWYAELGYRSVPLWPDSKVPCLRWREWMDAYPTFALYRQWFQDKRRNIAIVCGKGLLVGDVDDPDFLPMALHLLGETPQQSRSPSGGTHLWYRGRKVSTPIGNKVRVQGHPIDLRSDGGLIVAPPSTINGIGYEWLTPVLPASQLPVARIGWTRSRTHRKAQQIVLGPDKPFSWARAQAYMGRIEPAISGQGGHKKTFYAACKAVWLAKGDAEIAWVLLCEYNRRCQPAWDENSLMHKLGDALAKFRNP